uniref:Uncharacterized protein n=1 Tax=Rhizophora mucronata TaxID=61149 RepID=A0A2P2Q362_RHIMU
MKLVAVVVVVEVAIAAKMTMVVVLVGMVDVNKKIKLNQCIVIGMNLIIQDVIYESFITNLNNSLMSVISQLKRVII